MNSKRIRLLEGWMLTGVIGLALLIAVVVLSLAAGGGIDGMRLAIRSTARTSLLLFLLAFTASSLARLWPGAYTRWQLCNRRYFGVSFAISHLIHGVAILLLWRADSGLFWTLTNLVNIVSGGLAYFFILAMAATSFDRAVVWIGVRQWRILHKVGAWYIWISFMVAFGKRVPGNELYAIAVAALIAALALRFAAWCATRRSRPILAAQRAMPAGE